jgi:O-antigen/teichoic acid export membrane protein
LNTLRSSALRGLHHIIMGQLPESFLMPVVYVLMIILWKHPNIIGLSESWIIVRHLPPFMPNIAMALRFIATIIAFIVGGWMLMSQLPTEARQTNARFDTRNWIRSAFPLLLLGGMVIINTQTDIIMLAAIQGTQSAGVYQAVARGAELVAFSLFVINIVIQPTVSQLYAAGDIVRLQRVITVAARGAFGLALPIALILSFFGKSLLGFVFGNEFERGATGLIILCGGQVVVAAMGSVRSILNMTGHEKDSAIGMTIGAVTNVILNAILIPYWDINGAAMATGISFIVSNVILALRVKQQLGLNSTALGSIAARSYK